MCEHPRALDTRFCPYTRHVTRGAERVRVKAPAGG